MSRLHWTQSLKALFEQLEIHNSNKQKYVEKDNFLLALRKVKGMLPLQSRNDYYRVSSDVAFSFLEVVQRIILLPRHVTYDNVFDLFSTKAPPASQQAKSLQQRESEEQPEAMDESYLSEVNFKEDDNDLAFNYRSSSNKAKQYSSVQTTSIVQPQKNSLVTPNSTNEIFVLSFAEGVMMMANNPSHHAHTQSNHNQSNMLLAQAPLLKQDQDEDEACEIDSDFDDDGDSYEDSKDDSHRRKSKLEESIRSSRTATFKSIRNQNNNNSSHPQQKDLINNSSIINIQNTMTTGNNSSVQDSYYQLQQPKQPQGRQQQQQQQLQLITEDTSQILDTGSNHSRASSKYNDETIHQNNLQEKSTRLSSQNSAQKQNPHNQTVLSQGSSNSAGSSYQRQVANKLVSVLSSTHSSQNGLPSNFVDLNLQHIGLTTFEMDFRTQFGDKRVLRSINLALNGLIKLPSNFEKSLQYLNVSFNKLKSLQGLEACVNLKLLNVQGNLLTSAGPVVILQSMRELIIANNQLSFVKDIAQLKNLNLLDLSNNKLIDFEKIIPLQNLKKLNILSLYGNLMTKSATYEQQLKKLMPWVQVLDPDSIKDYTQFAQLENACFTDPPLSYRQHESQLQLVKNEPMSEPGRERSKTPNKDRNHLKTQLGNQLKSNLVSPKRQPQTTQSSALASARNKLNQQIMKELGTTGASSAASSHNAKQQDFKMVNRTQMVTSQLGVRRNENQSRLMQERSANRDKSQNANKSQVRDRSTSNNAISRNPPGIKAYNTVSQPSNSQNQVTQALGLKQAQSATKAKDNKRIQNTSQTKVNTTTVTTPRQEHVTHYYKKSFSQATEEDSMEAPVERNTIRTVDGGNSNKKQALKLVTNKKEELTLSPQNNQKNPMYQTMVNSASSSRNGVRPGTSLKQRPFTTQANDSYQESQQSSAMFPKSTKNGLYSQSFTVDIPKHQPQQHHQQSTSSNHRPSSQLQKFITSKSGKQAVQIPLTSQPCQKLTNLPPKAYLSKLEQPGDKKSKADMSINSSIMKQSMIIPIRDKSIEEIMDEKSNIRKMQVDLTQFMKPQ